MADFVPDLTKAPSVQALPELVRLYERQLDDALTTFGKIASALPQARMELNLSAVVGHKVLEHFHQSGSAVVSARGHSVAGHRLVDKVAQALDIPMAAGDERPKPSNDDGPQRVFVGAEIDVPAPVA